jgi:proteic killer suppression protein
MRWPSRTLHGTSEKIKRTRQTLLVLNLFSPNPLLVVYVILTYNLGMERVLFDKVRKNLNRLPIHIVRNLQRWALQVEALGIQEVRKIPGYHDEPLRGDRSGQRSIRLSKSYRAFYIELGGDVVNVIQVEEINKHEY